MFVYVSGPHCHSPDPCRLADDLLEESIHAVCEEVGEICSGLTKDIFSSEFVTPTMH